MYGVDSLTAMVAVLPPLLRLDRKPARRNAKLQDTAPSV